MLDDRKFYNDINSKPREAAPGRGGRGFGRGGRHAALWRPIGPDESVTMDRQNPYVGEHTPLVRLAGRRAQRHSTGRSRGAQGEEPTPDASCWQAKLGAKVTVSLVWGAGQGGRQAWRSLRLGRVYAKFPLKFTAGADSNDARIEIAGTGQGSFHIGAVSLMPADNIHGFRPDTIGLLKQQRTGMWRWPGGNYLSAHEWRDAIGDPDKRPPRARPGPLRLPAKRRRHRRVHDPDGTARAWTRSSA